MRPTSPRILFVDDNDDTRFMVEVWLGTFNYKVSTAASVAGGLRLARSVSFDTYVFDTNLPDGTGAELCAKIRQFDPVTPIIFFSGEAYPERRDSALTCGAQEYVVKPELDSLRQSIRRVINTATHSLRLEHRHA